MAQADKKRNSSIGATLWSLLLIACMLLAIGHLVQAISEDVVSEAELIRQTFTRAP